MIKGKRIPVAANPRPIPVERIPRARPRRDGANHRWATVRTGTQIPVAPSPTTAKAAAASLGAPGCSQEQDTRTEDGGTDRHDGTRAEAVRQETGKGCQGYVDEEVGVEYGAPDGSAECKVADHLGQDDTVAEADGIVDEEIQKADPKDHPGPVQRSFLHSARHPTCVGCKDFRQRLSRTLPPKSRQAGLFRRPGRFSYTMPAASLHPERAVTRADTSKGPSSARLGGGGRKRSTGVGLRPESPEKGMYLAFQRDDLSGQCSRKIFFLVRGKIF